MSKNIETITDQLLKLEDKIVINCLHSYAEFLESHHFGSSFEIGDGNIYETQHSDIEGEYKVVRFRWYSKVGDKGDELTEKEELELIEELKKLL